MYNTEMELKSWFESFRSSPDFLDLQKRPIAYFCAEFALSDEIRGYAGGLGILAGDVVREASDQQVPLVALGLYYKDGYLHHDIVEGQVTLQTSVVRSPKDAGFVEVLDDKKERLQIHIPLQGRILRIQAWSMQKGSVTIYLLDTNILENDEVDRRITDSLYTPDKEARFKQEIVLGIGGLRLLEALKIHPLLFHLNEGHSALLSLELTRHRMREKGKSFLEEIESTKRQVIFTNHTLIAAGNDVFSTDLVSTLLAKYAEELEVPVDELIKLGKVRDASLFSMTLLALRMAGQVNAVSALHAQKAGEIWKDHPMISVTNGIHLPTWDKVESEESLYEKHRDNKKKLLHEIEQQAGKKWGENELLIGWARRVVKYKRPLALFEELMQFKTLSENKDRPIHIVISGHSHQNDKEGARLLGELQNLMTTELQDTVVYLPNYRMDLAKILVAGCDMWLNTPIVGFEACGTSGMKAALNGALSFSTKDGWVAEADLFGNGWLLDPDGVGANVLKILEEDILPLYYTPNGGGQGDRWKEMMVASRKMILENFTATQMLQNYLQKMYIPALALYRSFNSIK